MALFKNSNIIKLGSKVFFITLLLVYIIQLFFIQSYTVSSSQMENLFYKGDRILVNKIAYGLRLPITPFTTPFTFDNIFGIKSYLDFWQIEYHRLFATPIDRNDIVLFNNPIDTTKPVDKRELLLSRCIAVSGDTLSFVGDQLYINGLEYIASPDALNTYKVKIQLKDCLKNVLEEQGISASDFKSDPNWLYFSLSRYQYFIVKNNFIDSLHLHRNYYFTDSVSFIIPKKGMTINVDESNIEFYKMAILSEDKNYNIFNETLSYTFVDNYYWFQSDNFNFSIDSRSVGMVSEKYIIGKPFFVWYKPSL